MTKRRPLGRTGRTISAVGLGCMGMSEFYGPHDDEQSLQTLKAALDAGVDFFDTADMYGSGHNEELIGKFLKGRRDAVVLATKFGIVRQPGVYDRTIDNSSAYIEKACEASLRRLGADVIDLYYCHRRNPAIPVEEMMESLAKLVKSGKIRAIGLSEVSPQTLRAAHKVHPVSAIQSEYSLWTRQVEAGMLETCKELGVTFVAYSPLGRGFLTANVTKLETLAEDDSRRFRFPRFQGEAFAANLLLAEKLAQFAEGKGVTAAQVALAWLMNKHDHVVPIPGTRNAERLAQNIAAADVSLDASEIDLLDDMFAPEKISGARYPENATVGIETVG